MIKAFIARNPTEAYLVQGLLRSRGIPAEVRGESQFTDCWNCGSPRLAPGP
jgi:hypothetical protein